MKAGRPAWRLVIEGRDDSSQTRRGPWRWRNGTDRDTTTRTKCWLAIGAEGKGGIKGLSGMFWKEQSRVPAGQGSVCEV